MLWKYAAYLQKNSYPERSFQWSGFAALLISHSFFLLHIFRKPFLGNTSEETASKGWYFATNVLSCMGWILIFNVFYKKMFENAECNKKNIWVLQSSSLYTFYLLLHNSIVYTPPHPFFLVTTHNKTNYPSPP